MTRQIQYALATFLVAVCVVQGACAQQLVMSVPSRHARSSTAVAIDSVAMEAPGREFVGLQMTFALLGSKLSRGNIVSITPRLVGERDSVDFPAVELYGRWAYLHEVRSGIDDDAEVLHLRAEDARTPHLYAKRIAYRSWMAQSQLKFVVCTTAACGDAVGAPCNERWAQSGSWPLTFGTAPPTAARPDTVEVVGDGPLRHFEETAYIDFPLDRVEIFPDYHENTARLAAIRNTLDSVLHHDRSLLRHITLKGYASPEGTYAHNEWLARGRTESLRRYLVEQLGVPPVLVTVDYEPEDWEGLRRYVASSSFPERQALLAIIDATRHPDEKLATIAARYPAVYRHLLAEVFPFLRHTDYRIDYTVQEEDRAYVVMPTPAHGTPSAASTSGASAAWPSSAVPKHRAFIADVRSNFRTFRPLFALKTNLLFDAIAAPNIEVEVPLGRKGRWSVMGEVWCPWWRLDGNAAGKQNRYYRSDQRPTKLAYELLTVGAEVRYWWGSRRCSAPPVLSGAFVGLYAAGGKYDLGRDGEGDQGEFTSLGLSLGYSWPLSRHWNLELSAAAGYVGGPKVHYQNEFDDARLIYRNHDDHWHYIGPTKLKVSVSWLIGRRPTP